MYCLKQSGGENPESSPLWNEQLHWEDAKQDSCQYNRLLFFSWVICNGGRVLAYNEYKWNYQAPQINEKK